MRIENNSNMATEWFYPILDFITQHTKYSALGTLYIDESKDVFSYGLTHKTNPELSDINLVAPSLVELWVRDNGTYPCVTEHVLGPVVVHNKTEEILLVLAHELRHLDEFHGYPRTFAPKEVKKAEIAAEQFAINMLEEWRLHS